MNPQLINECSGRIWAMHRQTLEGVLATLRAHLMETASAPLHAARDMSAGRSGAVAVIQIRGIIDHHDSFFLRLFGGSSIDGIRAAFRQALADDTVSAIVLDFDSPGGSVEGLSGLADEIYKARGRKPLVSAVNCMAASAAYWLAAQADEVVAVPVYSATGSIGVYVEHADLSRMLDQDGVTITLISAGDGKTDGNPYEPLSDEAKADMQKRVSSVYNAFVSAVARGRGVKAATIRKEWKAKVYLPDEAVSLGLADRQGTVEDAITRAASRRGRAKASLVAAEGEGIAPLATLGEIAAAKASQVENEPSDDAIIDEAHVHESPAVLDALAAEPSCADCGHAVHAGARCTWEKAMGADCECDLSQAAEAVAEDVAAEPIAETPVVDPAQLAADQDYIDTGIRIVERL